MNENKIYSINHNVIDDINYQNNQIDIKDCIILKCNNLLNSLLSNINSDNNNISIEFVDQSNAFLYINNDSYYLDFNKADLLDSYTTSTLDKLQYNGKVVGRLKSSTKNKLLDNSVVKTNNSIVKSNTISKISIRDSITIDEKSFIPTKQPPKLIEVNNLPANSYSKPIKKVKASSIVPWVNLSNIPVNINILHILEFFNSLSIKSVYSLITSPLDDEINSKSYNIYVEFNSNYGADLALVRSGEYINNDLSITVTEVGYIEACIVKSYGIILNKDHLNYNQYVKKLIEYIPCSDFYCNYNDINKKLNKDLKYMLHPSMIRSYDENYNIKTISMLLSEDSNMKSTLNLFNQFVYHDDHVSIKRLAGYHSDNNNKYDELLYHYKILFYQLIDHIEDIDNSNVWIYQSIVSRTSRMISFYELVITFSTQPNSFY